MLTGLFSAILPPNLNSALAEFLLASFVVFLITITYRFLGDQEKVKGIKNQISEMQKKIKEVKNNMVEYEKISAEMLKLTSQQMRSSLKPMIFVLIVASAFLPWMAEVFVDSIVSLPFSLPFFGNDFGWLGWYITASIPLSMVFRKALGVVS